MIWDPKLSKNDSHIRALIKNLPDGLEKTYERCLRRIEEQDPEHREIAAKAFRWVVAVDTPLTPRQAREVVSMDQSNTYLQESSVLNAPITDFCANLLTTDLTNRQVLFAHASVKQFLLCRSKIPSDLMRYHLDTATISRECAVLCLAYLGTRQSREQLIIQQGVDVAYLVPRLIENSLPTNIKLPKFARSLMHRSNRTKSTTKVSASPHPSSTGSRLEIHNFFLKNWLSLTSKMAADDVGHSVLQRLCRKVDPELFPWVVSTADENSIYQQIAQYSVINKHLPLLRAVRRYLETHSPGDLRKVFDSHCPGTNMRLVHMAAALGNTEILQELAEFCQINVFDAEREQRTPLAWAAEKSHFDTTEWLIQAIGLGCVDVDCCRIEAAKSSEHDRTTVHKVSLMTILAGVDDDDGFVSSSTIDVTEASFAGFCEDSAPPTQPWKPRLTNSYS